jgi:glucokinase
MNEKKIIGIDFGATNIRGGLVAGSEPLEIQSRRIKSAGSVDEVLDDLYSVVDGLISGEVKAIGIGVPSVVNEDLGIVYEVQNIPSWKEVHLKKILEDRYHLPVLVNNDANCFALGEYYFGKGKQKDFMIGLTIGTGLGAGIILKGQLFAGPNCGAGEFGMVDYLDKHVEYYASGQFFQNVHHVDGPEVFQRAKRGEELALQWYGQMGTHLGNAIKMIMYTYDASWIVLGGSVRYAYAFFQKNMWERINTFAYSRSAQKLRIELSDLEHSAVLGAACLYFDHLKKIGPVHSTEPNAGSGSK